MYNASITPISLGLRGNSIKEAFSRDEKIKLLLTEQGNSGRKDQDKLCCSAKEGTFFLKKGGNSVRVKGGVPN